MDYINTEGEPPIAQGVLKRLPKRHSNGHIITQKGQPILKQINGSDHHLWDPYTKIVLFAFNHQ